MDTAPFFPGVPAIALPCAFELIPSNLLPDKNPDDDSVRDWFYDRSVI
jgi:hypothetical protein